MNGDVLVAAMEATRSCHDRVLELADRGGWNREKADFVYTLTKSHGGTGSALLAEVLSVAQLLNEARLTADFGSGTLRVVVFADGASVLEESDAGSWLPLVVDEVDRELADRASDGDVYAAVELPASWAAEVKIDPARLLRESDGQRYWAVLDGPDALNSILSSRPWWTIGDLLDRDRPQFFALMDTLGVVSVTATAAIVGRDMPTPALSGGRSDTDKLDVPSEVSGLPSPECALPSNEVGRPHPALTATLVKYAAALAWAKLASAILIERDISAELEFFGFQRTRFSIGPRGPSASLPACQRAVELWRWTSSSESPDKRLAVRQVISLRENGRLWTEADDVRRAAEPIFLSLRSAATAESFKAIREARAAAITIARQTSESTATLTKGAVERTLATFGGVLAVVIARSTQSISLDTANSLRNLGFAFLVSLALWSALFEGPTVNLAIRTLRTDIYSLSEFVTSAEAKNILELESIKKAARNAIVVRSVVPLTYIAAGLAILFVARF